ncbi:hypothetical protein H6F92_00740 [Microcystis wesenbergii FACHB-1317]|uniref:hypothetical protein n=1 Tax=Microcystis aeruginosa TaxID=1126 RepID=UPI001680F473|nr:hypothetical protein [Microcystis aeruginosa]MBD2287447.1 hypothetical protein [Microcystis wesenbergii FACHB-1317]UZO75003.1 hypothetical protein M8120_19425 [Microcystis aeruginosa str. Chao 1910]
MPAESDWGENSDTFSLKIGKPLHPTPRKNFLPQTLIKGAVNRVHLTFAEIPTISNYQ